MSNLLSLVDKIRSFPPTKEVMFDSGFISRLNSLQSKIFTSKPKLREALPDDYLNSLEIFTRARLIVYLILTIQCESKVFPISKQNISHLDSLIFAIIRKYKSEEVCLTSVPCAYMKSDSFEEFFYSDQAYLTSYIEEWIWLHWQTCDPVEILFHTYTVKSEKILGVYLVGAHSDEDQNFFQKISTYVILAWEKWIQSEGRKNFSQRVNYEK